jgi:hypothetical protein
MGTVASEQGTKDPICAMRAMTPTWRIYVDFPPMLGPARERNQTYHYHRDHDEDLNRWTTRTNDLEFALVLDHLDIIRNEADVVLDLKTWMSCILENQVTGSLLEDLWLHICIWRIHRDVGKATR